MIIVLIFGLYLSKTLLDAKPYCVIQQFPFKWMVAHCRCYRHVSF